MMMQTMENNADTSIVSPVHEGKEGHPLLFRRKLFAEILCLQPPLTIYDVVHAHVEGSVTVEAPEWATFDVNTPQDYDELLQFMKTRQKP
jgi:CTP:molybdopterin cytidylyltransferase MocA